MQTILGALAFSDFTYSHLNAAGLLISMSGAVFYATNSALKVGPFHFRRGGSGGGSSHVYYMPAHAPPALFLTGPALCASSLSCISRLRLPRHRA